MSTKEPPKRWQQNSLDARPLNWSVGFLWKNDMNTCPIENPYICFSIAMLLYQKEKKIWSHFAGLFSSSWEQHCRSVCLVSPLPYLASSQADPVPVALDLLIKKIFSPNGGGEKWWWIQWWFHYGHKAKNHLKQMGVSKNSGTPKSSILIWCSIIYHPFWGTPIFGNTQIQVAIDLIFPANW